MAESNTIVAVRMARKIVGVKIPYDKLYFFTRDMRDIIPKVFGYALVLPFDEMIKKGLYATPPKHVTTRFVRRYDEGIKAEVPTDVNKALWWTEFMEQYDMQSRVVVVPILLRKRALKAVPRYLTTEKWFQNQVRRGYKVLKEPISDMAYLATPHPAPQDKIRPLCSICPRSLLQLQGECIPGQPVCYTSLDFNKILEGAPDGSVQSDVSRDA